MDLNTTYQFQLPYPPIQVMGLNPTYAMMMLSNVGARNSEMSAVSLYIYNHVILGDNEMAHAFQQISMVEMKHLEIFSKLALKLGADPRLWAMEHNRMAHWSPSYNQYPTGSRELALNALNGELAAIAKYEEQANTISDIYVVENLHRIILDEQRHVEIFKEMLNGL